MINRTAPLGLVTLMSEVAASASERLVPRQLRPIMDRTLVDMACAASGGATGVAGELGVDVPAVDAWRSLGVPAEFRARLTTMTVWQPLRSTPSRRCMAA